MFAYLVHRDSEKCSVSPRADGDIKQIPDFDYPALCATGRSLLDISLLSSTAESGPTQGGMDDSFLHTRYLPHG